MKRKLLALMLGTVLSVSMLAGCGSSTEEAAEETTEEVAEEEAAEEEVEQVEVYAFIAASLKNTMEEIEAIYEADHPGVDIIYNADSSGTLQTQIEEGAECDIFFSAATKQMTALDEGGYVVEGSINNLLENKIVLIKPAGSETAVTGFENITEASSLALAGEDVPVGQYARALFETLGITDQVMAMEINEGANVTEVLTAVAEASNEVGIVYATDAASMPDSVEIIAEATAEQIDPAIYPIGQIVNAEADEAQSEAAAAFLEYITTDSTAMDLFVKAGFKQYTE